MKYNKGTVTKLFGIKQEEMAALLKVSPGQWSMFESGKRDLPLEAKKKFVEMLQYLQSSSKDSADTIPQNDKTKKKLENLALINQHRQLIAARKIEGILKKQAKAKAALQLMDFLKNQPKDKATYIDNYIQSIQIRAGKDMKLNGDYELITSQLKLKVLQFEATLLKAALENLL